MKNIKQKDKLGVPHKFRKRRIREYTILEYKNKHFVMSYIENGYRTKVVTNNNFKKIVKKDCNHFKLNPADKRLERQVMKYLENYIDDDGITQILEIENGEIIARPEEIEKKTRAWLWIVLVIIMISMISQ